MNKHAHFRVMTASALVALAGLGLSALAQEGQPTGPSGRRPVEGEPTPLAFKQVTVEKLIDFIVQATGKVVIPQQDVMSRKITVLNDRPIPREQALDLVFQALAQNGVGVVENEHVITLRAIEEVSKHDVPVIPPSESVLSRRDSGTLVQKVFALRNSTAKALGDVIKDAVPDYAKLNIDEESNQVAIIGPISLQQRMERLITSLDRPSSAALQTETFRLRYADAEAVKANIEELFQGGSGTGGGGNRRSNQSNQNNQGPGGGFFRFAGVSGGGGEGGTSASTEVRVTANTQQNAVTVVADPTILDQIRAQINDYWDKQLPEEAVVPKVYDLKNSDPIKIRDALEGMFGRANPQAGRTNQGGGGQQGGNTSSASSSQGVGRLAGQFSFQAVPDAGRLIVVAKSQDNLAVIDKIIADLDQPQTVGLPSVVELKHASAEDLSEQLNALLAQDGTLASVRRSEQGLSASSSNVSPFSQSAVEQSTSSTSNTTGEEGSTAETIAFWWQRSRTPTDRRASSNLVGQLRIVPIWRQNALLVTAPPEYKQSVLDMIEMLDKPGRQVLIAAMVVEVSATDSLQLGLRWSSQTLNPSNADNSISIGNNASGTRNNWATSLFDTSVLNSSVNLNLLLQALSEKQSVNILSEPKVFTADNQEAEFFDGQDVLVPTSSQTANTGSVTQTFDYRAVGIQLKARPRITVQGDVDLRVNLQVSSISPEETTNGGFIFDRRQTTTQLIVKDRQTVVISGILRKQDTNILRKVPLLGDIPILGWAFRSRDKSEVTSELLVFITPVVVNNTTSESMSPVNEPFRQRLDELRKSMKAPDTQRVPSGPAAEPNSAPAEAPQGPTS
ncbi:MAG: hypothetical protein IT433_08705 [Phycisphaerales bacterium]|nr:hypothetical protein [Phycisphaerales bacterium]